MHETLEAMVSCQLDYEQAEKLRLYSDKWVAAELELLKIDEPTLVRMFTHRRKEEFYTTIAAQMEQACIQYGAHPSSLEFSCPTDDKMIRYMVWMNHRYEDL